MSTMSGAELNGGTAVLSQSQEMADGAGFKKAMDMLAQARMKPDEGFRKSIDDAISVVHAEWKTQRERELAERNRLERARQKTMVVREIMILPQLSSLCTDFATDDEKVLPEWQIQSGGDADTAYGMAVTPSVDDGGPSSFCIKAGATVVELGVTLNLTVECSCVDAQNLSTGKVRQIYEKTKAAAMVKFDDLGSEMWYHKQLEECARLCVLTKLRHTPSRRADAELTLDALVEE
jgi:hypothetical protein